MDSVTFGNILYISRAFTSFQKRLKLPDALAPSEMLLISYIYRHAGCTQDELVKFTGMDKTTVAHRLNKLEEKGFVRREVSSEDARKRLCFPTKKAEGIYPAIHGQYEDFKARVLGEFTEDELALFDRMTARMKKNAEALITDGEPRPQGKGGKK